MHSWVKEVLTTELSTLWCACILNEDGGNAIARSDNLWSVCYSITQFAEFVKGEVEVDETRFMYVCECKHVSLLDIFNFHWR